LIGDRIEIQRPPVYNITFFSVTKDGKVELGKELEEAIREIVRDEMKKN
jgi:hypothetical protein